MSVDKIDDKLKRLIDKMIKICFTNNGLGLSAPQIGQNSRFFVINKKLGEKLTEDEKPDYYIFINPRINWRSKDKNTDWEGCLSLPGLEGRVERSSRVRVKAQNLDGQRFTLKADKLLARVIQHESDHLEGILYIDYIKNKKDLRKTVDS